VALNMMDLARRRHLRIEVEHLSRHLGCPVVPVVASTGEGLTELKEAVARQGRERQVPSAHPVYDAVVERAVRALAGRVAPVAAARGVPARWLAIRLLERDGLARELTEDGLAEAVEREIGRIERHTRQAVDVVMADGRYGFIHGLARDVVHRGEELRRTLSDAIDRVMLNRLLGIPLFLAVMYGVFSTTLSLGRPFIDGFDRLGGALFVHGLRQLLEAGRVPAAVVAFLADGVGAGIQTVASFVPPIFLIFLSLAILEDSGYMARAAFVMDRLLRVVGLPGKAFMPMVVGFGCNVPGILAARTLENPRDRVLTVLVNPFMSCGARLLVYALFAVAFFPVGGGLVIFALYGTGILLGILTALLLRRTLLRGEVSAFIMELPPYHVPTVSGILYHAWHRLKDFILRAGKVIVAVVILLNLLTALGTRGGDGPGDSYLGVAARAATPVFRPMGITEDNWPAVVGLATGIFAKESVVATLDTLYAGLDGEGRAAAAAPRSPTFAERLRDAVLAVPRGFGWLPAAEEGTATERASLADAMRRRFGGRAAAVAYLLFVLIYTPCVASLAAIGREAGARWGLFSLVYPTVLAWLVATAFNQAARLPAHPAASLAWLAGIALAVGLAASVFRLLPPARRFRTAQAEPTDSATG